jgi:MYXO-CTERM domain-containing protein
MRRTALLFPLPFLVSCAEPEHVTALRQPVVGGVLGQVGQFPTVAFIVIQGLGRCTGTLVTPTRVLTAAHCLDHTLGNFPNQQAVTDNTYIGFDVVDGIATWPIEVDVADTVPHPQWSFQTVSAGHDFGFVELATPLLDRSPSPVNRNAADAPPGVTIDVAGYGVYDAQNNADVLHVLLGEVTAPCAIASLPDATFLCLDLTDGSGTCAGDSGSALFASIGGTPTVAAITSFGDVGCVNHAGAGRTDADVAFIDAHVCVPDGYCAVGCAADADCMGSGGAGGSGGEGPGVGGGGGAAGSGGELPMGGEGGAPSSSSDPPNATDDGGCSCSVPRRAPDRWPWLALLLVLARRKRG